MVLYELIVEDMSLNGHMGSGSTVRERKMFVDPNLARAYAENDFEKSIKWTKIRNSTWSSGNLMWVTYLIQATQFK